MRSGRPTGAEHGGGTLQGQGTAGNLGVSCISTAELQLPPPPGLAARAGQTSNFGETPMLPCLSNDRAIGAFWGCEGGAGSPRMIGSTNMRLRRDMGRFQGDVEFQRHQMLRQRAGCRVACAWTGGGGGSGGRRAAAAEGLGRCPKACTMRCKGTARTRTRALPHSLPCISENVPPIEFHA